MLRDLRRADGPQFLGVMERGFPEESALLGNRPEEFEKIFRRVFRWDTRLILGILNLFHRPIVRILVVEADGRIAATTLVSFLPKCAFVSNVVVDEPYRRKGFARQMLEEARRTAKSAHRQYIALDVLDSNTPARTLYESLGYRPLRAQSRLVNDSMARLSEATPSRAEIRPFRRSDVPALLEIARRGNPPTVEEVLPTRKSRFVESAMVTRMLESEEAAWVVDRGRGPEAHIGAVVSAAMEAAHLSVPVLADSVDPALAEDLVTTAAAWCAARKAPRILTMAHNDDARGRSALDATGFRDAHALWTLYRPVD